MPTPIASDLLKLILKLESLPYVSNSRNRFGRDMVGFVSENIRSSAYADTLYCDWLTTTPEMSEFSLTWHKKGTKDNAKSKGESGLPCLVPFVIGNGSKITPLALTLAWV